jgi:hypothetical protein
LGEKWPLNSCLRNISIHARKVLLHAVHTALLPLRRKLCYGFLSPLNIHRPRPGLNPRTLGPVASTLTTSPPRATVFSLRCNKQRILQTTHMHLCSYQTDYRNKICSPQKSDSKKDTFHSRPDLMSFSFTVAQEKGRHATFHST